MNARVRDRLILLLLVVLAASLALAPPAAAATCPGADDVQTAANVARARAALFCLLNAERRARGLRPLVFESHLQGCAQRHDDDMVRRRYFSHTTKGGLAMIPRLLRCGYDRSGTVPQFGEAIGYNHGATTTPRRMLAMVLASGLHRGWLLGARFTHLGIGVVGQAPFPITGQPGVTLCFVVGRR